MKRRSFATLVIASLVPIACAIVDPFPDLAATPPPEPEADIPDAGPRDTGRDAPFTGVCAPGTTRTCGFEACTGVERCTSAGTWAPCDARDASIELCGTALDESCDGIGACTGAPAWLVELADPLEQHALAITVDAEGNAYVVGAFLGDLVFGGLTVLQGGSAAAQDTFVMKVTRAGTVAWIKSLVDTRLTAVSAGKNDLVAAGNVAFASESGECGALPAKGYSNVLVTRWSFAGKCTSKKTFGTGTVAGAAVDVATDDVVLTGPFSDDIEFGGTAETLHATTEPGVTSSYVARLGPSLAGKHAQSFDAVRLVVRFLAVGPGGHVAIAGGSGDGPYALAGNGLFVATFDRAGTRTGLERLTPDFSGYAVEGLAFGKDERLYVAGTYAKTFDLGAWGGPVFQPALVGGLDLFLLRTNVDLKQMHAVGYGDVGNERPRGLAVDLDDNVVVTGGLQHGPDAGPVTLGGVTLEANAKSDVFVAKYGHALEHVWSQRIPGPGIDTGVAIAVSRLGEVIATGDVEGNLAIDGGVADGAASPSNVFVVKLRP